MQIIIQKTVTKGVMISIHGTKHLIYNITKLLNVVKGIRIKVKIGTSNKDYGIFPRVEADNLMNVQHQFLNWYTDLPVPIELIDINGCKYAITFTTGFSSAVFVYILRNKNDTMSATEKFTVDSVLMTKSNI